MKDNLLLAPDYTLRPFTLEDAAETVDLINACTIARIGRPETNLQEMLLEWKEPGYSLEEFARVLVTPENKIVAYADVWDATAPYVTKFCYFEIHPDHWQDSLALWMLEWMEETTRNRISLAPEDARVVLSEGIMHGNENQARVLSQAGFQVARVFKRMLIEMQSCPEAPTIPPGIVIRPIDYQNEFDAAIMALDEAFEDHWGHVQKSEEDVLKLWHHRLDEDSEFDPALWFLAMDGDQIAGACMCMPKLVEDPGIGWIAQLAVRRSWRKQGLGKALLQHAFIEFYKYGQHKVGLTVDSDSLTDATRLYTKAGMRMVRQFDVYHKELRPGKDLSTQEI